MGAVATLLPMGDTKHIIASRVRTLREEQGWSQAEFGQIVGLSRVQICRFEAEEGNLTLRNLDKILDGLGLTIENLFDEHPRNGRDDAREMPER